MDNPQIWTLIGVFAASIFSLVGIVSSTFLRVLRAEIGALRTEMNARFELIDRDISAIARRVFPDEP